MLREKIGEGGFGRVFAAEQPALKRRAVIKVLHRRHRANDEITRRFMREAQLASRLDHPYAAHVYAFGAEPDGLLWIAMELVRGIPLDQLLKTQGPLTAERFAPLLERICEVVHTAHEQGIVHRDLKPGNVMVISRAGRLLPKLLDFGIAKLSVDVEQAIPGEPSADDEPAMAIALEDTITKARGVLGSPLFMAPEQWSRSHDVGPRTDLYALGVLAYMAIAGRPPFSGNTEVEIARAHGHKPVPPLGDGFPEALDAFFQRALAKRADDRFNDALELARAFRNASGHDAAQLDLPRLDEALRNALLQDAPQPIAESLVALDAARSLHQAVEALWTLFESVIRYLGLLALACRSRVGPGGERDAHAVEALLRDLRQRPLSDEEWTQLVRELVRPFADRPDAYPIPELVTLFFTPQGSEMDLREDQLEAAFVTRDAATTGSDEDVRARFAFGLETIAELLRGLGFLCEYALVVPEGAVATRWMGARRSRPTVVPLKGAPVAAHEPLLLDRDGAPVLALSPLMQIAPPAPGAAEELFLFEGQGRRAAVLVSRPLGFERRDDTIWGWFRDHIFGESADRRHQAPEERAPYLGLSTFSERDAALFFGRERETEALLNRLRVQPLVTVVGPSGAGKSSLVHAGLVPSLSAGWRAISMRPGSAPMLALAALLQRHGVAVDQPAMERSGDPEALTEGLRGLAERDTLVLIVDQLEELFTLCASEPERVAFASVLATVAAAVDVPIRVVLTLRDDFLLRAESLAPLRDRLAPSLQLVTTPTKEDLERIVVTPARNAGYEFEDRALPGEMVAAVADQASALPLLSFAAAKLWELRDRHFKQLGRKAYESLGGVVGALARHADETLGQLLPEEQRLVREAFRHLVTAEGTRAVIGRADLIHALGDGAAAALLEKMVAARLLVTSEAEGRSERIEVVHEALLGAWPRLVEWRREDAEGARLRDQLRTAARQWDERARPPGLLWRGDALTELELWKSRFGSRLPPIDEAFASASIADSRATHRRRKLALAGAFTLLSAFIAMLALYSQRVRASAAEEYRRVAELLEDRGRQELLGGDPRKALVYLSEAASRGQDSTALRFLVARAETAIAPLRRTFAGHTGAIFSGSLSSDQKHLLTFGRDRTARVWELDSGRTIHVLEHPDVVNGGEISQDGELVATTCRDGHVRVFSLKHGRRMHDLETGAERGFNSRMSPDGRLLASAGEENVIKLWALASGQVRAVLRGHAARIVNVRFSGDGELIATSSEDGTARVWSASSAKQVARLAGHRGPLTYTNFDPSGRLVFTTSDDSTAKIWRRDGRLLHTLEGHRGPIVYAEFSPDGRSILTTSLDGTARLWEVETGRPLARFGRAGEALRVANFNSLGDLIVTSEESGGLVVWDVRTGRLLRHLIGHDGSSFPLSFPGHLLISAGVDSLVRVWDVDRGDLVARLQGHTGAVMEARFVAGDREVASISEDGWWRSFDVATGEARGAKAIGLATDRAATVSPDGQQVLLSAKESAVVWRADGARPVKLSGHAGEVSVASFAADGSTMLTGSADGVALLWRTAGGAPLRSFSGHDDEVSATAISHSGSWTATATTKGSLYLWAADGRILWSRGQAHPTAIGSVAFSPDDKRLATAGEDMAVKMWDLASGTTISSLADHKGEVWSIAFSPDGTLLATASAETASVWDARRGKLLYVYPGHTARVRSVRFSSDGTRLVSGAEDKEILIWRVDLDRRRPAELQRDVRCRVPFQLVRLDLQRASPDRVDCAATPPEG